MAVVELVGASIWVPGLAHDNDVGLQAKWIRVDGDGANVDIRVVTGSLTGRRAIEVPLRKLLWLCYRLFDGLVEEALISNRIS